MANMRSLCVPRIVFFLALMLMSGTEGAQAESMSKRFVYSADNNKKLAEALQDFAASQSMSMVMADGVDGRWNGAFKLIPDSFLTLICNAFSLYGLPIDFDITSGAKAAPELIAKLPQAGAVIADKGYDSKAISEQIFSKRSRGVAMARAFLWLPM